MAVLTGSLFLLKVNTVSTTYVTVEDMNDYTRGSNRDQQSFSVFGKTTQYTIPGQRTVTFTVSGFLNPDDVGQSALRTAEQGDLDILVESLPDGVNGFSQLIRVGSTSHTATPDGLQGYSFEFAAQAAATGVGTTPILL